MASVVLVSDIHVEKSDSPEHVIRYDLSRRYEAHAGRKAFPVRGKGVDMPFLTCGEPRDGGTCPHQRVLELMSICRLTILPEVPGGNLGRTPMNIVGLRASTVSALLSLSLDIFPCS